MFRPQGLLGDGEGSFEQGSRIGVVSHLPEQLREVSEAGSQGSVFRSQCLLLDPEGTLVAPPGPGEIPHDGQQEGEIVQRLGEVRMLGSKNLFAPGEDLLVGLSGACVLAQ